jgi:hypothetical protein
MRRIVAVIALILAAPTMAQEHPILPGNYKIATCVYRVLDPEYTGFIRLTDLYDEVDITGEPPVAGGASS